MFYCALGLLAVVVAFFAYFLELTSVAKVQRIIGNFGRGQKWSTALYSADPDSKEHGGVPVAAVLKAHGVDTIFTLVGGHISPILVACEAAGIRVVDTRHEVTAVFAADAMARLRQSIGVATVTAGPGLTNTVTAIKNAQMAESPVLLMGGAAATLLKGRGALQDIDQMSLFTPICKAVYSIHRIKDIAPTLRQAICAAQSGTPGPVFVEFPIDTLYPYSLIFKELGVVAQPKSLMQRVVNEYLQWHISRLFGQAFDTPVVAPIHPSIPSATYDQVGAAVDLIANAKRPLLLIGSQAMLPPIKPDHLRETVERLGVPVYLGGMARGLLGRQPTLQMRQKRRDALRDADVVIMAGTVADFRLSYGRVLSKKSKIIVVNRDPVHLKKNTDMFWTPTLAVNSDVGSFVVSVADRLQSRGYSGASAEWIADLRQRDDTVEAKNAMMGEEQPSSHLNAVAVCQALEKVLPDDCILVADGGDFVGTAAYTIRPRGPLQWLDPGAFGTLGVGAGFAIGAKLACPSRPVCILYGDGSLGYSLMEYDTYKRHKLPIISIVGNDACWSQIAREQVPMFNTSVACTLEYTPYHQMVLPLDAQGVLIDAEEGKDNGVDGLGVRLGDAFRSHVGGNRSALVNVLLGKSNFREGSISV